MNEIKGKKILIVEDELSMLKSLSERLLREDLIVFESQDGVDGLQKALDQKPDLILLDILLPKMDGLTMLKKLRNTGDYGKKVPVIVLTNLSADSEEIINSIAETGPIYYIVKVSMTLDQVFEKIKNRLLNLQHS